MILPVPWIRGRADLCARLLGDALSALECLRRRSRGLKEHGSLSLLLSRFLDQELVVSYWSLDVREGGCRSVGDAVEVVEDGRLWRGDAPRVGSWLRLQSQSTASLTFAGSHKRLFSPK